MKKNNLFTTIVFIFSIILFMVSGAIYVYSAQLQVTHSTVSVSYVADNVSFTSTAFYQVAGSNSITYFTDSAHPSESELAFVASDLTSYTRTLNASNFNLDVNNNYVLLTFSFTNDASEGGYCIKVSLTDGTTSRNNVNVTYLSSADGYTTTSAGLDTQKDLVASDSAPTDVYIQAQDTKYFYVLIEVDNLYLNANYTSTGDYGLEWNVQATTYVTEPSPFEFDPNNSSIITGLTDFGKSATSLTIPSTVTTLGAGAFDDVNPNLTSLTIPSSVTSIATTALQHVQYCDINWGEGWTAADKASRLKNKKVAAGFWPQTYVGYTLNVELNNANLTDSDKTGKSYRMASGTYYADLGYVILYEYEYNGARYVKGTKGASYELQFNGTVYFSDKNTQSSPSNPVSGMADGTVFYFKVEPIVTTVKYADNSNTQLVVLADKMLGTHTYNPDTTICNWQGSPSLYTYLNVATQGTDSKDHSFYLDSGLSGSEWSTKLCNYGNTDPANRQTNPGAGSYQIKNNTNGGSNYTNDNRGTPTYDPVWLPSWTEMGTGGIMGYTTSQSTHDANRKCELTDLAMATYASKSRNASNGVNAPSDLYCNWGIYFLRSAGTSDTYVCYVYDAGFVNRYGGNLDSSYGFRVAFAFNL